MCACACVNMQGHTSDYDCYPILVHAQNFAAILDICPSFHSLRGESVHVILCRKVWEHASNYWGERERAPPLMMSMDLASVRPRTSHRLRMRDIHVIYADSNSADCWFYTRTRSRSPPNVLHSTSLLWEHGRRIWILAA